MSILQKIQKARERGRRMAAARWKKDRERRDALAAASAADALGLGGKFSFAYKTGSAEGSFKAITGGWDDRGHSSTAHVMETRIPISFVYARDFWNASAFASFPAMPPIHTPVEIIGDVVVRSTWNRRKTGDGGIEMQTVCYLSHDLERNLLCVPYDDKLFRDPSGLFSNINSTFYRNSMEFDEWELERYTAEQIENEINGFHDAAVQHVSKLIIDSLALAAGSIVSVKEQ